MSMDKKTDALSAILRRLQLKADIFMHADYCGTWAVDTSGHRKAAFHLIGQGSCWLHLGEDIPPKLLTAGDFVMFPHDASHALSSDEQTPRAAMINQPPAEDAQGPITSLLCGFFEFHSKAAWPLLDTLPAVVVLDLKVATQTHTLIQLIIKELEAAGPGADVAVNELANVLLVHVLRAEMQRGLQQGLLCALADPKIGLALNLIHSQPGADWTVVGLAKEVGLSRSIFAERFKTLVGMSPMQYVTGWRMQEAVELLKTTDLSIASIAERCGYQSEVSFRKAFRHVIGKPPGQLRKAVD